MKDKVMKTGKKKPYYLMKSALFVLAFILLALIILSFPVGISYGLYLKSLSSNVNLSAVKEGLVTLSFIL